MQRARALVAGAREGGAVGKRKLARGRHLGVAIAEIDGRGHPVHRLEARPELDELTREKAAAGERGGGEVRHLRYLPP